MSNPKPLFTDAARAMLAAAPCAPAHGAYTNNAADAPFVAIPFTQYLKPNGRRADVSIERPAHIASMADRIMERGYRFECEVLTTGQVSLTIADYEGDHDIELCNNGIEVPATVDRLVTRFAARFERRAAA